MQREKILSPNHLYEVGRDIQPGCYLFSVDKSSASLEPNVHFNMYPEHPPVSHYRRSQGYFGVTQLDPECKYVEVKYGQAIYYGKPFDLYELLASVALDDDYHPGGVIVLENKLCTIKVYQRDRRTYLYHGGGDAEVHEQYLYSINGHKFWAGVLTINSCKSYNDFSFGFVDTRNQRRYSFAKGARHASYVYESQREQIRLYRHKLGDFVEIELPEHINLSYIELEWILPSFQSESHTERFFKTNKSIQELYLEATKQLIAALHKLQEIGIEIDIATELEQAKRAPDFLLSCAQILHEILAKLPEYQSLTGDATQQFTFPVATTYNKQYYCAAKLADVAERVEKCGDIYYITFRGDQIEEISLMYANLMATYNPMKKEGWEDSVSDYLYRYDFRHYLSRRLQRYLSGIQGNHGFYSAANRSVLVTINKELNAEYTRKLNELHTAMIQENRVAAKWSSEYSLFALISEYVPNAVYQYRTPWLRQQSFDIFLPSQRLAIEYQGLQHYEAVERFGGDAGLSGVKERDARKRAISAEHGIEVLDWRYDIPVDRVNVEKFLAQHGISYGEPVARSDTQSSNPLHLMAPVLEKKDKTTQRKAAPKEPRISPFVIRQFDAEGQFIAEYESIAAASEKGGISERAIRKVVYNERKTGGGFVWKRCPRDSDVESIEPVKYAENTGLARKILQLNEEGKLVAEYQSIGQAARQTGIGERGISSVLNGTQKTAGGYVWVYDQRDNS